MKKLFLLLAKFLGHLLVGTVMFLALLGAAVAASYGMAFAASFVGDAVVMKGAALLKYALFGIDVLMLLVFSVNAAIHFVLEARLALKESAK